MAGISIRLIENGILEVVLCIMPIRFCFCGEYEYFYKIGKGVNWLGVLRRGLKVNIYI